MLAKVAGPVVAGSWVGSSLLPATLAYSTVKGTYRLDVLEKALVLLEAHSDSEFCITFQFQIGVGWNDWGDAGLSDHEKAMTYPEKYGKK